jgi:hypothetical protein
MNIRFIKHLYSAPLASTVYQQRNTFTPYKDGRSEVALRDGEPPADLPILSEKNKSNAVIWRNAVNMISRIRRELRIDIDANKLPVVLGETRRVWLERIAPDGVTDWWRDEAKEAEKIARVILTLDTNPLARIHVGAETVHMEAGSLFWYQHRAFHCFANWGAHPVVSLTADFAIEEGE